MGGMADEPEEVAAVHAAQTELEAALGAGDTGAIAVAQLRLGGALAAMGDAEAAVARFEELLRYIELAGRDEDRETQRQLRMISPAAPPPGVSDVDLVVVATTARIAMAESLLSLGRRDDARRALDLAAQGTRGFGKGWLRKRHAAVAQRLADPVGTSPDLVTVAEQVAAADTLLAAGDAAEAARLALTAISRCADDQPLIRAQARQVLGMALGAMGRDDDATSVLRDSHADYLAADDHSAATTLAVALAWNLAQHGDRPGAIDLIRVTLSATEAGGAALRARLLTDLGSLQDQEGDTSAARTTLTGALATAETTGDDITAADARHSLAVVLATHPADSDDSVEALSLLDECRRAYLAAGLPDRAVGCDHEAAALLGRLGARDASRTRYERALTAYRDLPVEQRDTGSWPDEVADCETNLAALSTPAGPIADDPRLFRSGGHAMSHR